LRINNGTAFTFAQATQGNKEKEEEEKEMNWDKFIPVSKSDLFDSQSLIYDEIEAIENSLIERLENIDGRISEVEEPTISEEVRAIKFSLLSLPWTLKDDGEGFVSIIADDGSTVAVGVPTYTAESTLNIMNSYQ